MEQSTRDKEEIGESVTPPPGLAKEQNVKLESLQHYQEEEKPISTVELSEAYGQEGDEEEDDGLLERLMKRQPNQEHYSEVLSEYHPPLFTGPDSTDSNDFVKLEKPHDLFSVPHYTHPEGTASVVHQRDEITPSGDVAPPIGDDLRDFASSPQDAAYKLSGRGHQTFEQFLATTGEPAHPVDRDTSSVMHHRTETAAPGRRVAFDDDDEDTFRRQGPLTVSHPITEISQLQHDTETGLVDGPEAPTLVQQLKSAAEDAADVVGEFASKVTHEAQESAFKTKEMVEHGTEKAKDAVGDLLGFDETASRTEPSGLLDESPTQQRGSVPDLPETPVFLPPARPPTPPRPRSEDAPETPPVLDLGGPAHPHQQPHPYQRKPSLKISPALLGMSSTGTFESGRGGGDVSKWPSWFSLQHWDKNVLDLIFWRDPKKSGIVFGITLALLISVATFNVITVGSYLGLLVLAASFGYRIYGIVRKTEQKNPFQLYLGQNVELPENRVHDQVDATVKHTNDLLHHLQRLILVEDFYETLKFALLLWVLTYVGAYFSGTALVIITFVGLFTLPKVYEMYQPQIDHYYGIADAKIKQANELAREQLDKIPFLKKQKPVEKKE